MLAKIWSLCRNALQILILSQISDYIITRLKREISYFRTLNITKSLKSCGSNLGIQFPICFNQLENIEIGDNVSIAAFVHIWGLGGVKIGDRVMIGSHSSISSITHDYHADIMYYTNISKPVVIGNDVWIGTHAVVLPGVNIGNGAVIGAGCVVTRDVEPFDIVVGVPGRVLKKRTISIEKDIIRDGN